MVALDPSTGAILAMVTQPSYNPNVLASHDFSAVEDDWRRLTTDENQPMLNRGTQQILPPGSTFKLVTAAAALENLDLDPNDQVKAGSSLTFPGIQYKLSNNDNGNCGGNRITFERALNVSCNVSFGWLAGKVGQDDLAAQARKFGFGSDTLAGLASNPSRFTAEGTDLEAPQLAQTGIGQFEVAATPLQMAMVAGGIGNGGDVMRPYIVKTLRAPNLRVLEETEPERLSQAMSSANAAQLSSMMVSTVERGTATSARISGRRRRRQDRYGAVHRGPPAVRLVRLDGTGRQPEGRRRRRRRVQQHGPQRDRRRSPLRPDRPLRHGGGAGQVNLTTDKYPSINPMGD